MKVRCWLACALLVGIVLPSPASEFTAAGKSFPEVGRVAPKIRKMLDQAVDLLRRVGDELTGARDVVLREGLGEAHEHDPVIGHQA